MYIMLVCHVLFDSMTVYRSQGSHVASGVFFLSESSRDVLLLSFIDRNAGCAFTIMHSDLRLLYMSALGVICDLVKFMVFKIVCATANFYVTADLQSVFGFW